jgi:hypothetical protein
LIGDYSLSLIGHAAAIIDESEAMKISPRKLTSLERSRVLSNFITMNEKPEKYQLDNRFLGRGSNLTLIKNNVASPLENKTNLLKELIQRLPGGFIPGYISELSQTDIGRELNLCDDHGKYQCDLCQTAPIHSPTAGSKANSVLLPSIT